MSNVTVPQLAWFEPKPLKLSIPDGWKSEVYNMAGFDRPALSHDEIKATVANPIGMPPLRELAKGKKEVVILFDDTSRTTRVSEVVPFVLEELAAAGIPDSSIRFICAYGLHGALDRLDFVKKLGADVVGRFPVYNHNPFADCEYVGTTSTYKTKVYINAEVMACDLKIAIASVVPHHPAGFGGGGKIILPGVASIESVEWNHKYGFLDVPKGKSGMGVYDGNPMRADINEAAEMAGLNVIFNCIDNSWGETVAVYGGAMKDAYDAAVVDAKKHYLTPKIDDNDIAIVNAFASVKLPTKALPVAYESIKQTGGDIVLIANSPEGPCTHYWGGGFGKIIQARKERAGRAIPEHVKNLIIFTEYPDAKWDMFNEPNRVHVMYKWDDVVTFLQKSYGSDAKVGIYPNADIQYCG